MVFKEWNKLTSFFWADGTEYPMPNTRKMKSFSQTNLLWNSVTAPARQRGWTPGRPGNRSNLCFLYCFQTLGSNRFLAKQIPEDYLRNKDGVHRWPLIAIYFLSPKAPYVIMAWSLRECRDITVMMSSHCHDRRQNVTTERHQFLDHI